MIKNLLEKLKLGFLTRLSYLIIINVIFVFCAVSFAVFYSSGVPDQTSKSVYLNDKFNQLSLNIKDTFVESVDVHELASKREALIDEYAKLFDLDKMVQSQLYTQDENGNIIHLFSLNELKKSKEIAEYNELIDNKVITQCLNQRESGIMKVIPNTSFVTYYYHFNLSENRQAVIASVIKHKYLVVPRDNVIYLLGVLFLASILVSLLIVHLINKQLKYPLERLINGFEKTSQGELYSIIETDKDLELNKLSAAFNKMSKSLYKKDTSLKKYNSQLESANNSLKESQEFLSTVIDSSPNSVITTLPDGEIKIFSKKASEEFGLDYKDAIGKNINDLFTHPIEKIKAGYKEQPDKDTFEILCRRSDGSLFPAYLTISPVIDQKDEVSGFLYIIRDISESKSFQDMMIRIDRYYTKGQMIGDIAHEINNFLAILSGNVELLPIFIKRNDTEKLNKKLDLMKMTIKRIVNFTDGLMDSNEGEAEFVKADINQLTETVLTFLKPQNKFDMIEVETILSTDIPLVEIDPGQVQQLLVNLIYNAAEVLSEIEGDKAISITTALQQEDDEAKLRIEIKDNGPGVPVDKEDELFKKRFTTKRKGHGIGLITCQKIATTHNGVISYHYDDGACFSVDIPLNQPISDEEKSEEQIAESVY